MKLKKAISYALIGAMTIPMAACSFGGDGDKTSAVADAVSAAERGEGLFKEVQELTIPGMEGVNAAIVGADGKVYLYSTEYVWNEPEYDEEYETVPYAELEGEDLGELQTKEPSVEVGPEPEEVPEEETEAPAEEPVENEEGVFEGFDGDAVAPVEENKIIYHIAAMDPETCVVSTPVSIEIVGENKSIDAFMADTEGNFITIQEEWSSESENFTLVKYSATGAEIARQPIVLDNDVYGFQYSQVGKDGNIYAGSDQILVVFNNELKKLREIEVEQGSWIQGVVMDKAGDVNVIANDPVEYTPNICEVDLNGGKFNKLSNLGIYFYNFITVPGYDFGTYDNGTLRVYDKAAGKFSVLMDTIASDVDPSKCAGIIGIAETKALVAMYDDKYNAHIYVYEKVDPSTIVEKDIITLGCYYIDETIAKMAMDFNKKSEDSKIVIVDYRIYDNGSEPAAGMKVLKNDIASKNCPDILALDTGMIGDLRNIAKKNAFVDLGEYLDNDPDLSREDFLSNIIELCTVNNRIAYLPPSFYIYTYGMKEDLYNKVGGDISLDNIDVLEDAVSDRVFTYGNKSHILWQGVYYNMQTFLDIDNGKCDFESEEFIKLLNYANTYPDETPEVDYIEAQEIEKSIRNGRCALEQIYLDDFKDINRIEQATFGGNAVCVGFPSKDGIGAVLTMNQAFAISEKSTHKDACWSLVREYFLEDYQNSDYIWNLPSTKAALEARSKKAMEKPFYIDDETGEKVEYDDYYWIGEQEYPLLPMKQDRIDYYMSYIESVNVGWYYNDEVMSIISEEAGPFFAGDKTAEEVAKIIQSRVKIYVQETR